MAVIMGMEMRAAKREDCLGEATRSPVRWPGGTHPDISRFRVPALGRRLSVEQNLLSAPYILGGQLSRMSTVSTGSIFSVHHDKRALVLLSFTFSWTTTKGRPQFAGRARVSELAAGLEPK